MGQSADHHLTRPASLRRADVRFVLPEHPSTAVALGSDPAWSGALALAGIAEPTPGLAPELGIGRGSDVGALLELDAPMLLVEGPGSTRRLRAAGYDLATYVVLPDAGRPELLLSGTQRAAARYALRRRTAGAPRSKRLLLPLVDGLGPGTHARLRPAARVVLASKVGLRPRVLADVEPLGVPADASWFLLLGRHDQLAERRMAFLVCASGQARPSWAVKVTRLTTHDDSFERDQRGVDLLAAAAPACAHRAPRPLGQGRSGPFQVSVETAAVGDRLTELLRRGGVRRLPLARAVASWLIDLATTSRTDSERLDPELERIRSQVLPFWEGTVDGGALIDAVGSTPAVLMHGDVGTWNMLALGSDFSVIDWESARPGLALWDLLHFLTDASAQMARQAAPGRRATFLARLLRGEEDLSPFVFEHVRALADQLGLTAGEVGALATLCWMHYSAPAVSGLDPSVDWYTMQLARTWLEDPALGPGWIAWQ